MPCYLPCVFSILGLAVTDLFCPAADWWPAAGWPWNGCSCSGSCLPLIAHFAALTWVLCCRTFEVELPAGTVANKKITYTNPYQVCVCVCMGAAQHVQ